MSLNKNKRGFTVIELLIVITIIAVLATVLVVTLNPTNQVNSAKESTARYDSAALVTKAQFYYSEHNFSHAGFCSEGIINKLKEKYGTSTTKCEISADGSKWAVSIVGFDNHNHCTDNSTGVIQLDKTAQTTGVCG